MVPCRRSGKQPGPLNRKCSRCYALDPNKMALPAFCPVQSPSLFGHVRSRGASGRPWARYGQWYGKRSARLTSLFANKTRLKTSGGLKMTMPPEYPRVHGPSPDLHICQQQESLWAEVGRLRCGSGEWFVLCVIHTDIYPPRRGELLINQLNACYRLCCSSLDVDILARLIF